MVPTVLSLKMLHLVFPNASMCCALPLRILLNMVMLNLTLFSIVLGFVMLSLHTLCSTLTGVAQLADS